MRVQTIVKTIIRAIFKREPITAAHFAFHGAFVQTSPPKVQVKSPCTPTAHPYNARRFFRSEDLDIESAIAYLRRDGQS